MTIQVILEFFGLFLEVNFFNQSGLVRLVPNHCVKPSICCIFTVNTRWLFKKSCHKTNLNTCI